MYLGIEIGGTKLQLGVGSPREGDLVQLLRMEVDREAGAEGILSQIQTATEELLLQHPLTGIGIGFGGPVDFCGGLAVKSHHVAGWDNFPLVKWCEDKFGLPAVIGNDCDVAGLAEALFGAGKGFGVVFYTTVGTGIGGGLILNGQIHRGNGAGAAEIGHLRPGLGSIEPGDILEKISSGWGITATCRLLLEPNPKTAPLSCGESEISSDAISNAERRQDAKDLAKRCDQQWDQLTTKMIAEAAADGNKLAGHVLREAIAGLGWGIGQAITLIAPHIVVVGGGVSLLGEERFFGPLREQVSRYVFPPFRDTYQILPALLGEEVVIHGAIALAAQNISC